MQTTFELAKLFYFHTCETKINLSLRLKIQTKILFVLFFFQTVVVASMFIFIFSRNARVFFFFQKKKIENISVKSS